MKACSGPSFIEASLVFLFRQNAILEALINILCRGFVLTRLFHLTMLCYICASKTIESGLASHYAIKISGSAAAMSTFR
jgi:hypothetical protein